MKRNEPGKDAKDANTGPIIIDGQTAYSDDDPKPQQVTLNGELEGYSHDVLIDLDGYRKDFRVGWYDYDDDEWRLHDTSAEKDIDRKNMRWLQLPLAGLERKV